MKSYNLQANSWKIEKITRSNWGRIEDRIHFAWFGKGCLQNDQSNFFLISQFIRRCHRMVNPRIHEQWHLPARYNCQLGSPTTTWIVTRKLSNRIAFSPCSTCPTRPYTMLHWRRKLPEILHPGCVIECQKLRLQQLEAEEDEQRHQNKTKCIQHIEFETKTLNLMFILPFLPKSWKQNWCKHWQDLKSL